MDRFSSIEEYKAIWKETKARIGNTDTNCFLMSREFVPYIDENRLSYQVHPEGLLVFVDEAIFYEMYYLWDQEAPFPRLDLEKRVSVVEINKAGKRNEYIRRMEEKLTEAGFCFFKTSSMWALETEDAWTNGRWSYQQLKSRLDDMHLRLLCPIPPDVSTNTIALWERELDCTDVPLSHKKFLQGTEDQTACILDEDDQLASAYWWHVEKMSAEGRHIVTNPLFSRRGLGSFLLLHCVRCLAEIGIPRLTTYISDSNVKSIRLHKNIGFQRTDKTSSQFIFERK